MAMVKGCNSSATHTIRPPRGLFEVLPNLLRDKKSLQFKHPELRNYISGLDKSRFYDKAYLEGIKVHMEQHKLVLWKRLDVTITVESRLISSADHVKGVTPRLTPNGTPQRVLDFYHSDPKVGERGCEIVEQGSNLKPWVMRCGSSVGVHGIKRVARMIAIIRACIDPDFDPEGDSPIPPTKVPTEISQKRKREFNRMMREMNSREVSSPEYFDVEETVATKVQRLTVVVETAK